MVSLGLAEQLQRIDLSYYRPKLRHVDNRVKMLGATSLYDGTGLSGKTQGCGRPPTECYQGYHCAEPSWLQVQMQMQGEDECYPVSSSGYRAHRDGCIYQEAGAALGGFARTSDVVF